MFSRPSRETTPLRLYCVTHQGFKGHQLHDVLSCPGSADLTADVDFSYLRRMAGGGVACLGPVTQRTFLKNMGIDSRMQASRHTHISLVFTGVGSFVMR